MEKDQAGRRQPSARPHTLAMDNRRKADLTGISEVIAFDDNQVILGTDQGEIVMTGEGLHVTRLMLEDGQLSVEGRIDGLYYAQRKKKRGIFGRSSP